MITVAWIKSTGNVWLKLTTVDLSKTTASGVYMIWHEGQPGRVVRIGQGDIAARLRAHRADPKILAYQTRGALRVTWAALQAHQMNGVERYLANLWHPLVGDAFPDSLPIAVNSPFAA